MALALRALDYVQLHNFGVEEHKTERLVFSELDPNFNLGKHHNYECSVNDILAF